MSNMTVATSGTGSANTSGLSWGSCYSIYCVMCSVMWINVCLLCAFGHCTGCPSIYGFSLPHL